MSNLLLFFSLAFGLACAQLQLTPITINPARQRSNLVANTTPPSSPFVSSNFSGRGSAAGTFLGTSVTLNGTWTIDARSSPLNPFRVRFSNVSMQVGGSVLGLPRQQSGALIIFADVRPNGFNTFLNISATRATAGVTPTSQNITFFFDATLVTTRPLLLGNLAVTASRLITSQNKTLATTSRDGQRFFFFDASGESFPVFSLSWCLPVSSLAAFDTTTLFLGPRLLVDSAVRGDRVAAKLSSEWFLNNTRVGFRPGITCL
jgi:hypothetical protein